MMGHHYSKEEKAWIGNALSDLDTLKDLMERYPGDTITLLPDDRNYICSLIDTSRLLFKELLKGIVHGKKKDG